MPNQKGICGPIILLVIWKKHSHGQRVSERTIPITVQSHNVEDLVFNILRGYSEVFKSWQRGI
ncbi:hypothetical protein MAR_008308 [Mya arenaria]|uniref:Uncharacterized protein n=1 Tax=Mya arenaria TaxID=6604 RepID=A0ABY7DYL2_MYAAR|nr:hypothetical protein MAR_008308 [Mya arenaria]